MAGSTVLERYRKLLKRLMPRGRAWDWIEDDLIGIFEGLAGEPCRVDERAKDLLIEFDPGTATELLEDWERLLGLPDDCTPESVDLNERRQQARQKLAAVGGISASFYETLAASLGFTATVRDFQSFRVGRQAAGDRLTNPFVESRDLFRVGANRAGDILVRHGWQYCFEVQVPATVVEPFRVGENRAGDPLVTFGNEILECTFKKLKPAHTCAFFTFS